VVYFPAVAVLLLVPYSAVAYRRRGRLGLWRSLTFFFYLYCAIAAFLLTLMPAPRDRYTACVRPDMGDPQLTPGNFVVDFIHEMKGHYGPSAILHNPSLYQVGFNLLLLAPLGFFLRYYSRRSLPVTIAVAFTMSMAFEATQGTGLWGGLPLPVSARRR
jgi:glycopeptide antibiotics resistance protein